MSNPAPGFANHPNHTVDITPSGFRISVTINQETIGETNNALVLAEANYPTAYYLPLETLPVGTLQPSDHTTYCPFKGTANYYHLTHGGSTYENAVWCYRDPYDEVLTIKDHIAIYSNVAKITPI